MGREDSLEELKTEPTEPVLVGNNNFFDITFDCGVQKGKQSRAFEINARSNILNDSVTRELFGESGRLTFQIFFLFPRGNAGVTDFFPGSLCCICREEMGDVGVEESTVVSGGSVELEFSLIGPIDEGSDRDIEQF